MRRVAIITCLFVATIISALTTPDDMVNVIIWGESQADLISRIGNPDSSTRTTYVYLGKDFLQTGLSYKATFYFRSNRLYKVIYLINDPILEFDPVAGMHYFQSSVKNLGANVRIVDCDLYVDGIPQGPRKALELLSYPAKSAIDELQRYDAKKIVVAFYFENHTNIGLYYINHKKVEIEIEVWE